MKDKKILKKWWFWLIIVIVLSGLVDLVTKKDDPAPTPSTTSSTQETTPTTLPALNSVDYEGKEGLVVYKELKVKGYTVDAVFDNEALTEVNGKASDVFDSLDPNKIEDRQSVDNFVVISLAQTGDTVQLTIGSKGSN